LFYVPTADARPPTSEFTVLNVVDPSVTLETFEVGLALDTILNFSFPSFADPARDPVVDPTAEDLPRTVNACERTDTNDDALLVSLSDPAPVLTLLATLLLGVPPGLLTAAAPVSVTLVTLLAIDADSSGPPT
jgi:hypothetical protein